MLVSSAGSGGRDTVGARGANGDGRHAGRAAAGLAVVRVADGERAGLGSALRREVLGRSLVVTPLVVAGGAGLLGYVWGPRDRLGQTWQDQHRPHDGARRPPPAGVAQGPEGPVHVARIAPAPGGLVYAAWWERFGAWLIDFALVLTAVATVMVSVAVAIGGARTDGEEVDDTRAAIVTFVAFGATFIGMALYNAIGIGWRETTLGKQAVGLVVRAEDGSRAGYGRAFNRELLGRVLVEGLLSAFTLGIFWIASGLAAAADRKRQAWHDKMGQTMVVLRPRRAAAEGRRRRRCRPSRTTPRCRPRTSVPPPPERSRTSWRDSIAVATDLGRARSHLRVSCEEVAATPPAVRRKGEAGEAALGSGPPPRPRTPEGAPSFSAGPSRRRVPQTDGPVRSPLRHVAD